ncbi:hypothetical protein [Anaplasma platys]|uniref:hypothetical protein n=1 Tax=Anaplasma platys TaxID=949 RepID=UPI00145D5DD7|nr:hypothetical protein [Anaplasma platys]
MCDGNVLQLVIQKESIAPCIGKKGGIFILSSVAQHLNLTAGTCQLCTVWTPDACGLGVNKGLKLAL